MLTAAVDHLWQSTLVALAAAAIVLALRRRGAHVRYWIWFGASMKFLIPFALLIALGEQLAPRSESRHESSWVPVARQWLEPMTTRASPSRETAVAAGTPPPAARNDVLSTQPPTAEPTAAAGVRADQPPASTTTAGTATTKATAATTTTAGTAEVATREAAQRSSAGAAAEERPALVSAETLANPKFAIAILAIWLLGSGLVVAAWCRRWITLAALARNARPLDAPEFDAAGLEVRVTPATLEPGVFGIVRSVLLLPAGIAEHLSRAELESIVRHERVHVARRDNLTALLHMLVEAAFWFHPLVWWIGKRLVDERERACDEAVLASGIPAKTYAAGILNVCDAYLSSPLRCTAGVSGGVLEARVARIIANRMPRPIARRLKGALVALPAAALALPIAIGALNAPVVVAQPAEQPAQRSRVNLLPLLFAGSASGTGGDFYFMSLEMCHVFADLSAALEGEDFGPAPNLQTFADLVRYAYELERDELAWLDDPTIPNLILQEAPQDERLQVRSFARSNTPPAILRRDACRAMLRSALEHRYGLEMHRDGGRWVVDRIDIEPLFARQRTSDSSGASNSRRTPLIVDAAVLDAYAGYYQLSSETEARDFAPVFAVLRDGDGLALDWSGRRFTLLPVTENVFSTSPLWRPPTVLAHFVKRRDGRVAVIIQAFGGAPDVFATKVDASPAAAHIAAIERRARAHEPARDSRELIDEIAARLASGDLDGNSRAAVIARSIRGAFDPRQANAPEIAGTSRIELIDVLPSGRDVFELHFDDATVVRIEVVAGLNDTIASVSVDGVCRDGAADGLVPCMVWRRFGSQETDIWPRQRDPEAEIGFTTSPRMFLPEATSIRRVSGSWALQVSLAGCPLPDTDAASETTSDVGPVPVFGTVSGLVAYAYALPPQALAWPIDASDPDVQLAEDLIEPESPSRIVRHSECRAFLRRALAAEIGLVGRFETGIVRQWELTVDAATTRLGNTISSQPKRGPQLRKTREAVYAVNVDMARFAQFLSLYGGEPVFDRTALTDRYDFSFVWEPVPESAPDRRERELEAIRAAMRPWWGLALEPSEREMTRLIVERAEPPSVPDGLPR